VIEYLRGVFRDKPLAHWQSWFAGLDASFAPVNTLREALDDPNAQARALVVKDEQGREHIAPVVRFLHEPAEPDWHEPALDEHHAILDPKAPTT
jgi:crotonobetainyl-CoA:carnitine CoA-transferase CaiB-like acyl-CoA transferase